MSLKAAFIWSKMQGKKYYHEVLLQLENWRKKFIHHLQSRWWQNVHFWVNYPIKDSISSKNKNSVINYSPSCRSKPVRPSFFFKTQIKIFFRWNPRAFWPSIDSNATDTFKAQKRSKDNVVITMTDARDAADAGAGLVYKRRNAHACVVVLLWIKLLFLFSLHIKSILVAS